MYLSDAWYPKAATRNENEFWSEANSILSESIILLFKGEFFSPTTARLLNIEKSVITIGGIYLFSPKSRGLNEIKPSILPK